MTLPVPLRTAAWLYSQQPDNSTARERFEALLADYCDPATLTALADQFSTAPAVCIPALRRLSQLSPKNVGYLAHLGFSHYMAGEDEAAADCLQRARDILPEDMEVLNLAAALARDDDARRGIYARILELHPDSRAAFENLVLLRKPEDD